MIKTFDELCNEEEICNYCKQTNYGEHKECITPDGYWCCEGSWCSDAYEIYLDENNTTENIIKYASLVNLLNKEIINER